MIIIIYLFISTLFVNTTCMRDVQACHVILKSITQRFCLWCQKILLYRLLFQRFCPLGSVGCKNVWVKILIHAVDSIHERHFTFAINFSISLSSHSLGNLLMIDSAQDFSQWFLSSLQYRYYFINHLKISILNFVTVDITP